MQTLKIEIPEGFEIETFDEKTGEIKFKKAKKVVTERIKTIDDVLKDNNTTEKEVDKMFKNVPEHLKYQYLAELLCKSLNEGWEPDWDDSNEYKYYPWFKMGSSGFRCNDYDYWNTIATVGSRLCFKSSELAKYARTQFTDTYQKFMEN